MRMVDEADFDYEKYGFREVELKNGIVVSYLDINNDENENFKKGSYRIVSCHNLLIATKSVLKEFKNKLCDELKCLLKLLKISKTKTVLICGLGNEDIVADSLGYACCKKILATRLLNKKIVKSNVCSISPNVQSVTGIQTFDIVYGVAKAINADLIILIDSLMTNNIKRLGHSFQMSSCGMVPGGAMFDNREISLQTTGIKCLSIGVPLMLDLKQLSSINKSIVVSPKDIKFMIEKCSKIIADVINIVFNPNLSYGEIEELLNPI